jgi:TP901 family phage tail tape measure protein
VSGAESFTVLAILEARDQASEIFAKIDESLDKFSDTAKSAADTARAAGEAIDESLLQTASGADALDLADARVAAAQAALKQATDELVNSERALLEAQQAAAEATGDGVAAASDLTAADARLAAAQKDAAAAAKGLSDAQKVQSDTAAAAAAKNDEAATTTAGVTDASEAAGVSLGSMGKIAGITALGLGVAGAVMVKAAGNFQSATQHLVTDAGESQKNLAMVQAGILSISTATGTSAADITNAMYHIESAGIHGAAGLDVARIAAEGAKVGGADLDTVSKALVGTMATYYGNTTNAANATQRSTAMMNELIAIVGSGDMKMQDLASSLSSVAPIAAKAGISLAQVGGAIATMTSQNMTAQQATQDLGHTISSLLNPTSVQTNEMAAMGLSSQQVASQLGKKGLTGTIAELTGAITSHMGKAGTVLMSAFNQSTSAAQDANIMLKQLPPSIQSVAKGYLDGTVSYNTWYAATKSLPLVARTMADQFATTAGKAKGFNNILTAGGPAAQTYNAALAKMIGGNTGLKTALMLSGNNAAFFASNAAKAQKAADAGGTSVSNWSAIQGTFNQKVDVAKTAVENTGIAIGSALLPAVSALLGGVTKIIVPIAEWTAKHKTLTEILFGGVTAIAATIAVVAVASKTFKAVKSAVDDVGKAVKGAQAALQKLGIISKQTASEQETAAGEAAAAEEEAAAEGAAAQEEAAAASSSSWLAAAASAVAGWAAAGARMVAQAAVWVAQNTAKVAVVVAENIAGALSSAAAWIAANALMLGGIGLVVLAVVAAVLLIVTHWKQVSAAVAKVWDDVYSFISKVVSDVVNFVKSHWQLLLAIITGPLGLAVLAIVKYWGDIKKWFSDGVHDVESILSWFGSLPGRFRSWLGGAASAVASAGSRVLSWFEGLPGRILHLIEEIPSMLFSSGEHIIESLASGITSAAGSALSGAMSSVANTIKSFLPFSPAKKGPLSGAGDPGNSGLSIARKVARGIQQNTPLVASAAKSMASAAVTAATGLTAGSRGIESTLAASALEAVPSGAAGGGGTVINLHVTGNTVMSDSDINKLVTKIGKQLSTVTLPASGRKINIRG